MNYFQSLKKRTSFSSVSIGIYKQLLWNAFAKKSYNAQKSSNLTKARGKCGCKKVNKLRVYKKKIQRIVEEFCRSIWQNEEIKILGLRNEWWSRLTRSIRNIQKAGGSFPSLGGFWKLIYNQYVFKKDQAAKQDITTLFTIQRSLQLKGVKLQRVAWAE